MINKSGIGLKIVGVFFFRASAAFFSFLLNFLIARNLPIESAGYFFWALSIIIFLAVFSRVGLDYTVVKNLGYMYGLVDKKSQMNFIYRAFSIVTFSSVLVALVSYIVISNGLIPSIGEGFNSTLKIMLVAIPFLSTAFILAMIFQGISRSNLSVLFLNLLLHIVLSVALISSDFKSSYDFAETYVYVTIFLSFLAIAIFVIIKEKDERMYGDSSQLVSNRKLIASCMPLWAVAISQQLTLWFSQIVGGYYLEANEIVYLAISLRTSLLIGLVLLAINTVASPKMAKLYGVNDIDGAKKLYKRAVGFAFFLSLPVFLVFIIYPENILGLIGTQYTASSYLLIIFSIGQFINAITGPVGFALAMSGNERKLAISTVIGGCCAVMLSFILIPRFGVTGAAVSTTSAIIIQNLVALNLYRKINLSKTNVPFKTTEI